MEVAPGSLFKPRHSPSTTCCAETLLSLSSCTSFRQLWPPETFREDFRKSLLSTFLAVMGNKVYSISRRFQRLLNVHLPVQGKNEQEFPVNTSRYPLTYLLLPKSSGSPGNSQVIRFQTVFQSQQCFVYGRYIAI